MRLRAAWSASVSRDSFVSIVPRRAYHYQCGCCGVERRGTKVDLTNTIIIMVPCSVVNMSYSLTVKVFDGIFGQLPHILLLSAVLSVHLYSGLSRNSSIYGATMPDLSAIIAIIPSTVRSGRMLCQPVFRRRTNRQERQEPED